MEIQRDTVHRCKNTGSCIFASDHDMGFTGRVSVALTLDTLTLEKAPEGMPYPGQPSQ